MQNRQNRVLVVGAGFAGAVYARVLAEANFDVTVIDRRDHIGGNAYDEIDERGVRIHKYGPHLFHTSNQSVVDWVTRFSDFVPYQHKVTALVDNRYLPFPVNKRTVELLYGVRLPSASELKTFLQGQAITKLEILNAADLLESRIGTELTELFFRRYTRKMWCMELEELDASIVRRVEVRDDNEDRYFPSDSFQGLPAQGYTKLFERVFDHQGIGLLLNTPFDKGMLEDFDFSFLSCPIDEFFGHCFGELPYRSIRFHSREPAQPDPPSSVVNYTHTLPYTRETFWHLLPGHAEGGRSSTLEEPCDYKDNFMERYYPVKDAAGKYRARYDSYAEKAKELATAQFIGRCGTYTYLDMHQVISQSLAGVRKFVKAFTGQQISVPLREREIDGALAAND